MTSRFLVTENSRNLSILRVPAGNLYVYAGNSPITIYDPYGLCNASTANQIAGWVANHVSGTVSAGAGAVAYGNVSVTVTPDGKVFVTVSLRLGAGELFSITPITVATENPSTGLSVSGTVAGGAIWGGEASVSTSFCGDSASISPAYAEGLSGSVTIDYTAQVYQFK